MRRISKILLALALSLVIPASVFATVSIVPQGGTGAASFLQGWLYSNGGTSSLNSSTSPTVAWITATSSLRASVFPYASTTALSGTYLCLSTDCRTVWPTGALYPFNVTGNATSTLTQFNGGLTAYASTTIGGGGNLKGLTVSGNSTTTGNAAILGTATIGTLTGPLQALNGVVSASTTLSLVFGGTGLSTLGASSTLLQSNGTSLVYQKLSPGLFTTANVSQWTNDAGYLTSLASAYPFQVAGNATSTLTQFNGGLTAFASSTIGNGTQAGGLTVSGGATTTGTLAITGTGTSTSAGDFVSSCFANSIGAPCLVGNGGSSVLSGGSSYATQAAATTFFYPLVGTEVGTSTDGTASSRSVVSKGGTIQNLYVNISKNLGSSHFGTTTIMKNGVASAMTCTISGAVAITCNDITHTFSVVPGDELGVMVVLGTAANAVKINWTIELLISAATGGADRALDNLTATAVNASLIPGTDKSIELGTSSARWSYISSIRGAFGTTSPYADMAIQGPVGSADVKYPTVLAVYGGTAPGISRGQGIDLYSGPSGGDGTAGNINIVGGSNTGNGTGGNVNISSAGDTGSFNVGGNINITAGPGGTLPLGNPGNVILNAGLGATTPGNIQLLIGNVGVGTTTPDSGLDVSGTVRFEGLSATTSPSISGAIVGIGCDSATMTGFTGLASSTVFVTTPQSFPGVGISFYTMALASTSARVYVCSAVTATPNASTYNIRIIK